MTTTAFERTRVGGVRLHVLPTDRFKTFAICAYIGTPLTEGTVTPVALTPFVLRRGNKQFPETKRFREHLDELFGAGFGFDVMKRGDYQIVTFRMDIIEDRYVHSGGSLLEEGLRLLLETISEPAMEGDTFLAKYVETEKETVRKKIEAIINDKIRYAAERCIEEMCGNEPYRLLALGRRDDLKDITPETLTASYREWLQNANIDLYVVGNTTSEQVESIVNRYFSARGGEGSGYRPAEGKQASEEVRTVVEPLDVNQGKLNMGLRSTITYGDQIYPAALMYNGVLGGYPHSKLFTNVREKASLAYYASSRLEGHKGILTIQSGIEMDNYEKAVQIIKEQLEAMARAEITDTEMSQTRAMIGNQLREMQDSAFEIVSFDFNSVLSGVERTAAGLIEAVSQVDKDAIRQAAERFGLDTIYFLRDRKEGN